MKRRLAVFWVWFFWVVFPGFAEEGRPNILWITIEDTSPQYLGCYGNPVARTPNLDRLAEKGVRFTQAFANGPVCSSARSAIITGCSTETLGTGNHRSQYAIPGYVRGFPAYLRDQGYYTSNCSKRDYNIAGEKAFSREAWDESSDAAGWWNRPDPKQPFFAVFNFIESHQSRTMTHPWAWYEAEILKHLAPDEVIAPEQLIVPPVFRDSPEMRRELSRVYNSLTLCDQRIGELLRRLETDGLAEETILLFFADHGQGIPAAKCNPIGQGYRVPMIAYFPDKWKHLSPWGDSKVCTERVSFLDLAPSMLSLVGAEIPGYMDGRAFWGDARKPAGPYLYLSRNRIDESPDLSRSVTDGRYLYTRFFMPRLPVLKYQKYSDYSAITRIIREDSANGRLNAIQQGLLESRPEEVLFDLEEDPWEIRNLIDDPDHRDRIRAMREAVLERMFAGRDAHLIPEYAYLDLKKGQTIAEERMNETFFPIAEVMEVIRPTGEDSIRCSLDCVASPETHPFVRYWAAVNLWNRSNGNLSAELRDIVASGLKASPAAVQIELAGVACDFGWEDEAWRIWSETIAGDHPAHALQVMQKIAYLRNGSLPFRQKLESLAETLLQREEEGNLWNEARQAAEVYLWLSRKEPLHYQNLAKWEEPETKAGAVQTE
jgi:arylsulfatase A-like enzyme